MDAKLFVGLEPTQAESSARGLEVGDTEAAAPKNSAPSSRSASSHSSMLVKSKSSISVQDRQPSSLYEAKYNVARRSWSDISVKRGCVRSTLVDKQPAAAAPEPPPGVHRLPSSWPPDASRGSSSSSWEPARRFGLSPHAAERQGLIGSSGNKPKWCHKEHAHRTVSLHTRAQRSSAAP